MQIKVEANQEKAFNSFESHLKRLSDICNNIGVDHTLFTTEETADLKGIGKVRRVDANIILNLQLATLISLLYKVKVSHNFSSLPKLLRDFIDRYLAIYFDKQFENITGSDRANRGKTSELDGWDGMAFIPVPSSRYVRVESFRYTDEKSCCYRLNIILAPYQKEFTDELRRLETEPLDYIFRTYPKDIFGNLFGSRF